MFEEESETLPLEGQVRQCRPPSTFFPAAFLPPRADRCSFSALDGRRPPLGSSLLMPPALTARWRSNGGKTIFVLPFEWEISVRNSSVTRGLCGSRVSCCTEESRSNMNERTVGARLYRCVCAYESRAGNDASQDARPKNLPRVFLFFFSCLQRDGLRSKG